MEAVPAAEVSPRSSKTSFSNNNRSGSDPAAATSPADVVAISVVSLKLASTSATATAATFAATARAQRKKQLGGSLGRLRVHPRLPHLQRGGDQVGAGMHTSRTPPLHPPPTPSLCGADDENLICNGCLCKPTCLYNDSEADYCIGYFWKHLVWTNITNMSCCDNLTKVNKSIKKSLYEVCLPV
jgi:hypothetical protein